MTCREIAELVGSRHDKVKQSIERLASRAVIELPPLGEVKNHLGQTVSVYIFSNEKGKRDSLVVVAQLSPEFTGDLVDRWQELEAKQSTPTMDPAKISKVEWIQMALESEKKKLALEAKLEEQAPKINVYERIVDSEDTVLISDAAKVLKVKPAYLFGWMQASKWIFRRGAKGRFKAHQDRIDSGVLVHKTDPFRDKNTGEGRFSEQVRVTGKGLALLARRLNSSVDGQILLAVLNSQNELKYA